MTGQRLQTGGPTQHPPPTLPIFHRVIEASLPQVRQSLIDIHDRFDRKVPDDALGRMELVLAEVLNNIVHHGTGAGKEPGDETAAPSRVTVHVTVTGHDGGLACAVVDDGSAVPHDCLLVPDTRPGPEIAAIHAGGFGWFIIRDLTRSLFYYREGPRNVLCFNIPRKEPVSEPDGAADVA